MIRSCYEMMGIIIITTIILGAIGVAAILSYRLYRLCRLYADYSIDYKRNWTDRTK